MAEINLRTVLHKECGYTVYANTRGKGAEFREDDIILECLSKEELENLTIKEIIQGLEMRW